MLPPIFRGLGKKVSLVDKNTYKQRLAICKKCEHRKGVICGSCGCPLLTKAGFKLQSRPEGKWSNTLREINIEGIHPNFVGGWFIEDPKICDDVIELFDQSHNKIRGCSGSDLNQPIEDLDVKDSWDVALPHWDKDPRWVKYMESLAAVKERYREKFPWCDNFAEWSISEMINIQYYPPNGGYKKWHTERASSRYPNTTRHLVFMTYLNDVEDEDEFAGGTEFFHQGLKLKARKGLTLIWPADWTHVHRGIVSENCSKYIVTGWYSFID